MIINKLVDVTKKLIFDHTTKPKPTIILGLSGGPDSVFLFHLLNQLMIDGSINLIAVHIDHCWRKNSAHDAAFCQQLCEQKNIQYELYKNGEVAAEITHTGSHEDYGRRLRRHCFQDARIKHNADFIALAHHRQDQQETFFVRLLRGSSLNGLRCMDSLKGAYLRPLLDVDKDMILSYLATHNISYCNDQTNSEDTYLRNRIRKYVIPALKSVDQRFDQKFESTLHHLKAEDDFLTAHTAKLFTKIFSHRDNQIIGDLKLFQMRRTQEQKRLVIKWLIIADAHFCPSDGFINEVITFLSSPRGGSHALKERWTLHKKRNQFWIENLRI